MAISVDHLQRLHRHSRTPRLGGSLGQLLRPSWVILLRYGGARNSGSRELVEGGAARPFPGAAQASLVRCGLWVAVRVGPMSATDGWALQTDHWRGELNDHRHPCCAY